MLKTLWQIPSEPLDQCIAFSTVIHQCNATTNFRHRYDTDKGAILVESIQPFKNARIGARLCHL